MDLVDCRRLTGPSLVCAEPCAVLEVELAPAEADRIVAEWSRHVRAMLDAIGWRNEQTSVHRCSGGALLVLSAPADGLYAATEIAEWAWQITRAVLAGEETADFQADVDNFLRIVSDESNPDLIRLADAARRHDVTFLADEERVSVGLGSGVRSWPARALPQVDEVPWEKVHDIPVALVAGVRGTAACVRLVASIVEAAGRRPACATSSEATVGDEIIERGDCTDAQSARDLLRERRAQIALLETHPERLRRRGLPVPRAAAALLTSAPRETCSALCARTPQERADMLWSVTRALDGDAPLVLNADDPVLVVLGTRAQRRVIWYGTNPLPPMAAQHIMRSAFWTVRDGSIGCAHGGDWRGVAAIAELAGLLESGDADVSAVLAAAALAQALRLPDTAIEGGLREFERTPARIERLA